MPYKIQEDKCTSCGTCAEQCPQGAVKPGPTAYRISADLCIDCGACEAACPSGAPVPGN